MQRETRLAVVREAQTVGESDRLAHGQGDSAMSALAVVQRPNGKIYRARKAPECRGYRDDHREEDWVGVLRTHDVDLARQIARPFVCSALNLERPILSWWRETIRNGERWIDCDDVRGAPCVLFEEVDE